MGTGSRALSGPGHTPMLQVPEKRCSIDCKRSQAGSVAALVSPRDPNPFGGIRNTTLHRQPSHWMGELYPTYLQAVGPLTYLSCCGLTLHLHGWEDQRLSQGIVPSSGVGRRGRYRGEGLTSGVTSTFDPVRLLWPLLPRTASWTPYSGGYQSRGSLDIFLLPKPELGSWLREPMKPNKLVSCLCAAKKTFLNVSMVSQRVLTYFHFYSILGILKYLFILLYVYGHFDCMHVYAPYVCLVSTEVKKGVRTLGT